MPTLLTIPLRSKRALLVVRQRARQVAALLRYDCWEQACVAAGAFAVAAAALTGTGPRLLEFQLENNCLRIAPVAAEDHMLPSPRNAQRRTETKMLQLVKPLPEAAPPLASDDLKWVLRQLSKRTTVRAFEEIERQNQEVLVLLHALRQATPQAAHSDFRLIAPSAA